jgi:hypothetical protein
VCAEVIIENRPGLTGYTGWLKEKTAPIKRNEPTNPYTT